MRCLVASLPLPSHVYPFVPLARELARRGHDVRIATASALRDVVADTGLGHVVAGEDWAPAPAEEARDPAAARQLEFALKRRMFTSTLETMFEDLRASFASFRPDCVIVEQFAVGAVLACEVSGIPHALASFLLRPVLYGAGTPGDPEREGRFQALGFPTYWSMRAKLGLAPDPDVVAATKFLTLDMLPPSLHFIAPDYQHGAATAHPVRPVPWAPSPRERWQPPPAGLPRPLVHVTFGTIVGARRVVEATITALRDLPVTVVVATRLDLASLGPLPPNVHVAAWVDHAELLPRCDVVVHHGGLGTMLATVTSGVPSVALPQFADHPINAAKIASSGAGIALAAGEQTPSAIRAAVERVLADDLYRRNAARLQRELSAMPGLDYGAVLLERLAATKRPIPRGSLPTATQSEAT